MPFEAFKIGGIFNIESNAAAVFTAAAEAADAANASLKALMEQSAVLDRALAGLRTTTLGAADASLAFGRESVAAFDKAAAPATTRFTVIRREMSKTFVAAEKLRAGLAAVGPGAGGVGGAGGGIPGGAAGAGCRRRCGGLRGSCACGSCGGGRHCGRQRRRRWASAARRVCRPP